MASPEEVAEDLDAYVLRGRATTREDRGYAVLIDGPDPTPLGRFASRLRLDGNPDPEIAAIRGWFRERDKATFTWKLGTHTTPTDLEARLRAHGAHEDEAEPDHTAMVLETEPPGIDEIEVRVVESYEDYVKSAEIMFIGFGGSFSGDEVAAMRAALPKRYADYQDQSATRRYLPLESLRSEVGQRFPRHAAAAPIALLSVLAGTLR